MAAGFEPLLREAVRSDIDEMHRVRMAVRENQLVSTVISPSRLIEYIEDRGRGWVMDVGSSLAGIAIADSRDACLWALFVEPAHEGKGFGRMLHDVAVRWLFDQGHDRISLSTGPGTRAESFYRTAGWRHVGENPDGELRFELTQLGCRHST